MKYYWRKLSENTLSLFVFAFGLQIAMEIYLIYTVVNVIILNRASFLNGAIDFCLYSYLHIIFSFELFTAEKEIKTEVKFINTISEMFLDPLKFCTGIQFLLITFMIISIIIHLFGIYKFPDIGSTEVLLLFITSAYSLKKLVLKH